MRSAALTAWRMAKGPSLRHSPEKLRRGVDAILSTHGLSNVFKEVCEATWLCKAYPAVPITIVNFSSVVRWSMKDWACDSAVSQPPVPVALARFVSIPQVAKDI